MVNDLSPPLVSVYILNHNYGRFIDQAVQSVLHQTFRDWELIVIDDGSTDNSRELIQPYLHHEKVAVIFQKKHGLTVSNNIALRMARGQYIMRLDADDFLDENALGILSGVLDRHPDAGLVFSDFFLTDAAGQVLEVVRRHNFDEVTLLDQPAHGACTMLRKRCLLELGGYDESIACQDGFELWLRFIRRYQVKNVNLPLFYYRRHQHNLTGDEARILATQKKILANRCRSKGEPLKALAIVPVRGRRLDPGSPAMVPLAGKPLIAWTIEAALKARTVSHIMVSSPEREILTYVRNTYGDKVLSELRPSELAMFNTPVEQTIDACLASYAKGYPSPDAIALLFVEAPFRSGADIDAAVHAMQLFGTDVVIGVRPEEDQFYQHNGQGLIPIRQNQLLRLERENLFREAGRMRIIRRSFFEKDRKIDGGLKGHVILDPKAALRLRTEFDWEIAEILAHSPKR